MMDWRPMHESQQSSPAFSVVCTDVFEDALALARAQIQLNKLDSIVTTQRLDWCSALSPRQEENDQSKAAEAASSHDTLCVLALEVVYPDVGSRLLTALFATIVEQLATRESCAPCCLMSFVERAQGKCLRRLLVAATLMGLRVELLSYVEDGRFLVETRRYRCFADLFSQRCATDDAEDTLSRLFPAPDAGARAKNLVSGGTWILRLCASANSAAGSAAACEAMLEALALDVEASLASAKPLRSLAGVAQPDSLNGEWFSYMPHLLFADAFSAALAYRDDETASSSVDCVKLERLISRAAAAAKADMDSMLLIGCDDENGE
jgi:hypothetical protein